MTGGGRMLPADLARAFWHDAVTQVSNRLSGDCIFGAGVGLNQMGPSSFLMCTKYIADFFECLAFGLSDFCPDENQPGKTNGGVDVESMVFELFKKDRKSEYENKIGCPKT